MKKGLGRGFDSLIPSTLIDETFDPTAKQDVKLSTLQELEIASIVPDIEQPRRFFDEEALAELAASIKEHGVLQPIVVSPNGAKYVIVAGERRWRASQRAGLKTIPAIVRSLSDQHRLEISLIENLQRRDLNAIETATAYLKLRDQFNMTLEQIGERVGGKSPSSISNTLRLLKLPKLAQEAIFEGRISEGQARPLIGLDETVVKEILTKIINEDWSARKVEQWVVQYKKQPKAADAKTTSTSALVYDQTIKSLSNKFKSNIDIKSNTKGSGKIIISFKDEADFKRISQLLD